jgi:DNA repair exonuclease SbcCD ATPase subunit
MGGTKMNIHELQHQFSQIKEKYTKKTAERDQLLKMKDEIFEKMSAIDIESLEKVSSILQKLSEKQRYQACKKLESLCTFALQYSLSTNYEMEIDLSKFRGKPSADVYIKKIDSGIRTSPIDGNGGGVIDIVSIALRFVTMQVHEPFIDGPVILDEPYKMVSKEFIPMISEFMKKLSSDFGRQIILSTHNEFLSQVDNQIRVSMGDNNESEVDIQKI